MCWVGIVLIGQLFEVVVWFRCSLLGLGRGREDGDSIFLMRCSGFILYDVVFDF